MTEKSRNQREDSESYLNAREAKIVEESAEYAIYVANNFTSNLGRNQKLRTMDPSEYTMRRDIHRALAFFSDKKDKK